MKHTDSPETVKNPKKNKDSGKSPQELYDASIQKGDETIIAEDLTLSEKYYRMQYSGFPCSIEELIVKAHQEIAAERAAKKRHL